MHCPTFGINTTLVSRYQFDVRHIEKLLCENEQRKDKLRLRSNNALLTLMIILLCLFFVFYQI